MDEVRDRFITDDSTASATGAELTTKPDGECQEQLRKPLGVGLDRVSGPPIEGRYSYKNTSHLLLTRELPKIRDTAPTAPL